MSIRNTLFKRFEFIGYSAIVALLIGLAACGGGGDRAGVAGIIPSVSLFAGNADGPGSADGTGGSARFYGSSGMANDSAGNVYVAESYNHIIRKITKDGVVSTLAGLANYSGSTDGTGSDARFNFPLGVATDSAGNVYVADAGNNKIRKITPAGVVTTLAGSGAAASSNNATGTLASFNGPQGVATDNVGNVYVADTYNHLIRIISASGAVATLAGSGMAASNNSAIGTVASFNTPVGVATDSAGHVYVADTYNHLIRSISTTGSSVGEVTTIAGAGTASYVNATGTLASFSTPHGIATDNAGNLYVADFSNHAIRKITSAASGAASAVVTTLAGSGTASNVDAAGTLAGFNYPRGVSVDSAGNVFVGDYNNHTVRKITTSGVVSTFAGKGAGVGSTDGSGADARFNGVIDVATDSFGNVYAADANNYTIRKISASGLVSTFAGASGVPGTADGRGSEIRFVSPGGVAIDNNNNLYVVDNSSGTIRKIPTTGSNAGVSSTIASGFNAPRGMAVDIVGNIYVADRNNHNIRKITPDGTLSTFAGTGSPGSSDGKGVAASFTNPWGVATDSLGNVYVTDNGNQTIRKITPAGEVKTLAGEVGVAGNSDGGGIARFFSPRGIVVNQAGNVYVADTSNHTIRKITPDGVVSTVVGLAGKGGMVASGLPGIIVSPQGMTLYGSTLYYTTNNGVAVVRNLP